MRYSIGKISCRVLSVKIPDWRQPMPNSYEAVAYLDTDCGQPEFTPPGFVSLSVLRAPVLGQSNKLHAA